MRRVSEGRSPALADLAVAGGYYDQAHLAREFRGLAGCPPSRWLAEEFRNVQGGTPATGKDRDHDGSNSSTSGMAHPPRP